jgi:serine/threonine protein phosphatase PrpC
VLDFFKKIFGKETPPPNTDIAIQPISGGKVTQPITLPIVDLPDDAIPPEAWPASPQIVSGWGQSVGRQRDHNEDALYTFCTTMINENEPKIFGLLIVADGMGGHQHGEIASGVAIRALSHYVIRKLYLPLFASTPEPPEESLQEVMQSGIAEAHRAILKHAPGGGTTLTAALIVGDQMTITHVGDSRAYLFQGNGQAQVLTRDHSLVKRLEELGQLTPEEAAQHPQRNVLYRALGQGEPFEPDINTYPLPKHGYLMLCSDGLWGVVPEKELFHQISQTADLHQACQGMVNAANQAGGPDNISVVLARLTG